MKIEIDKKKSPAGVNFSHGHTKTFSKLDYNNFTTQENPAKVQVPKLCTVIAKFLGKTNLFRML